MEAISFGVDDFVRTEHGHGIVLLVDDGNYYVLLKKLMMVFKKEELHIPWI